MIKAGSHQKKKKTPKKLKQKLQDQKIKEDKKAASGRLLFL